MARKIAVALLAPALLMPAACSAGDGAGGWSSSRLVRGAVTPEEAGRRFVRAGTLHPPGRVIAELKALSCDPPGAQGYLTLPQPGDTVAVTARRAGDGWDVTVTVTRPGGNGVSSLGSLHVIRVGTRFFVCSAG